MHQEFTLDVKAAHWGNYSRWCDQTTRVDCETGAIEEIGRADSSRILVYGFTNPYPGMFTWELEAAASNPLVWGAPDVDWIGQLSIAIIPDSAPDGSTIEKARIDFSGFVEDYPAFEMYAAVNGGPGHPVFQRFPDPGSAPINLSGPADQIIRGTAIIDCLGNPAVGGQLPRRPGRSLATSR
jgi:hypothetical protein